MTQEIKDLIEKINQEGIEAAQKKAQEIEGKARQEAEEILKNAKKESEKLISDAKTAIERMDAKEKTLLAQAGRDFLLSLKKEVNSLLSRIIVSDLRQALSADYLAKIVVELAKGSSAQNIVISLKKEDCDALEKGFLAKLKEETRKGITLKPSEDIRAGFIISFDAGKSCYDFSDKALAEYIGEYLKPKLSGLLKEASSG